MCWRIWFIGVLLFCTDSYIMSQDRGTIYKLENGIYVAAVNVRFESCHAQQQNENWCWAACVEMVLKYQNVNISQKEIVERAFGADGNVTANGADIVRAASGWYYNGTYINAKQEYLKSVTSMIDDLAYHYPIIIGLKDGYQGDIGHAYVLTHIYYRIDVSGNVSPFKVVLIDPWITGDQEKVIDWNDFYKRITTIVHVYRVEY